jgi:hypothetical protein
VRFALLFACVLLEGCQLPEPRPFPLSGLDSGVPPYSADAEPVPNVPERAACGRMCDRMRLLGCSLGKPTVTRTEPCLSWCTRVQSKHEIDLHPDCIAQVASCVRIKDCEE